MSGFLFFLTLQFFDAATTLVFLRLGIAEANPVMRMALAAGSNQAVALALPKAAAAGLAFVAFRTGRVRMLGRVNVFFLLCVAWNLAAIAARLGGLPGGR